MPTTFTITDATNASPIVCTSAGHPLGSGDLITVASVGGNTSANGTWIITKVDANTFSLNNSVGVAAYTSGGIGTLVQAAKTITDATNATPIVVTSTAHGLSSGNVVTITGVGGNTSANGIWSVTVIDADTFSLQNLSDGSDVAGNSAYTSGGAFTVNTIDTSKNSAASISIKEYSTMSGTGDVTLNGPVSGYSPFRSLADQTEVQYTIDVIDASGDPTGVYETGLGTYNSSSNTVTRNSVGSTSSSTEPSGFFDLPAGNKTISAIVSSEQSFVGISWANSTHVHTGMISMAGNAPVGADSDRFGRSNTVTFAPMKTPAGTDPVTGTITLLRTGYYQFGWLGPRQRYRAFVNVPITIFDPIVPRDINRTAWITCRLDQPSAIPVAYDPAKLPSQDHTYAQVPADIFMYMPWEGYWGPYPRPIMFYMNWATATARKSAGVGHDLLFDFNLPRAAGSSQPATNSGQQYLYTGDTWCTETDAALLDESRFLYVGTVCGNLDGEAHCETRTRLTWSQYNRFRFSDGTRDAGGNPGQWDVSQRDTRARMNYGDLNGAQNDGIQSSTWRHFGLQMSGVNSDPNALPDANDPLAIRCSMGATVFGGVRLEIRTHGEDIRCIRPNRSGASVDSANRDFTTIKIDGAQMDKVAVPAASQLGFHIWSVAQSWIAGEGWDGNASNIGATHRVYGDGKPLRVGDPGIINPVANPPAVQLAGPCYFLVEGEC
jgi:hypothetical protein